MGLLVFSGAGASPANATETVTVVFRGRPVEAVAGEVVLECGVTEKAFRLV
jgi:hypothetical protein